MATAGSSPQKTPGVRQFPMIDDWSIKEKLALASQVQRSGDQNWFSVSRSLGTLLGDTRPDGAREKISVVDEKGEKVEKAVTSWFEKKNCARQYQDLLEKREENKPKTSGRSNRRGGGRDGAGTETDEDIIVKELTQKRMNELDEIIKKETEKLKKIQEELDIAEGPDPPEEFIKMIWDKMIREEKEEKNRIWLEEREAKFIEANRRWRPGMKSAASSPRTAGTTVITVTSKNEAQSPQKDSKPPGLSVVLIDTTSGQTGTSEAEVGVPPGPNPPPSSSPLLTSLLQNPPEKSPDGKSVPPGLTLGQSMAVPVTPVKGSPVKTSPSKGQPGLRSPFFDANSALASAAARQFNQTGSTSPGNSQPGSGSNTPRSMSPSKSTSAGGDVHTASPTLSKLLEIPISNVSGNKLPPLPIIERRPRISSDSQEVGLSKDEPAKDSESITRRVKEELLIEDESANDGVPETAQEDEKMQVEPIDETSSSIPGEGEDSSVASATDHRSPRASRSDISDEAKNKSTPQTRRSARQQGRGSVSKVPSNTPAQVQTPLPPPLTAKPTVLESSVVSNNQTPSVPATRRSTRVRTKVESEGDNSNHPPSESSKMATKAPISEADQSTMDVTAAPDSEVISEESLESMPKQEAPSGLPEAASSVTGHISTSTKRGPPSLLDIDSVPNSPASSIYGANEDTKDWRKFQRDMLEKWKTIKTHQLASEFEKPVKLPGYDEVVRRPMDLITVSHNLKSNQIRTLAEFKRDVMLIFINAMMYNEPDIPVHQEAMEVLNEFLIDIEEYERTTPPVVFPTASGRSSAAGQSGVDQGTAGQTSASGEGKIEKGTEKKTSLEGRTTPVPKTLPRVSSTRRRGDSSSVVSESKDPDSVRLTRRLRGVSTDTDPGPSTGTPTTTTAGQSTTGTGGSITPSVPKTRSKK